MENRTFAREQQIVNFRLTPKINECYITRAGSQRLRRILCGIELTFKRSYKIADRGGKGRNDAAFLL